MKRKVNPEDIGEIQVFCPIYEEDYVVTDPRLVCPACGEVHTRDRYMIFAKEPAIHVTHYIPGLGS